MKPPPSYTDVHKCSSLLCTACTQTGSVFFVKAAVPKKAANQCKELSSGERSQASTAPSSPSPSRSQKTLTPPPSIARKQVLLENISSVGVIRAFRSNDIYDTNHDGVNDANKKVTGLEFMEHKDFELNVPYKLTRSKSMDSLDRFVANIESGHVRDDEEDPDYLIFGTPWKGNM